jgi:hypothetical protein
MYIYAMRKIKSACPSVSDKKKHNNIDMRNKH